MDFNTADDSVMRRIRAMNQRVQGLKDLDLIFTTSPFRRSREGRACW